MHHNNTHHEHAIYDISVPCDTRLIDFFFVNSKILTTHVERHIIDKNEIRLNNTIVPFLSRVYFSNSIVIHIKLGILYSVFYIICICKSWWLVGRNDVYIHLITFLFPAIRWKSIYLRNQKKTGKHLIDIFWTMIRCCCVHELQTGDFGVLRTKCITNGASDLCSPVVVLEHLMV